MLGAVIKTYYADKTGIDPRDMKVVSVMPCTAKKFEAKRPELNENGEPDVDEVITTRELARMIRAAGIDFASLPDEEFDSVLGESTGAGVIFGATGGVMEAALRFAYEVLTGKTLENVEFEAVRGLEGVKEASLELGGLKLNIAVAHGTANAQKVLDSIRSGEKHYDFIEVMCCPGGCINGGGQPYHRGNEELLKRRAEALYAEDAAKPLRKSHENPDIQALYEEFLGEPCGPLSHELLHTRYYDRKPVVEPKK